MLIITLFSVYMQNISFICIKILNSHLILDFRGPGRLKRVEFCYLRTKWPFSQKKKFSLFFYLVSGKCLKSPKNQYKSSLGYLEKSVGNRFLIFLSFSILWPPTQRQRAKIAKKGHFWIFTVVKNPEKKKIFKICFLQFFLTTPRMLHTDFQVNRTIFQKLDRENVQFSGVKNPPTKYKGFSQILQTLPNVSMQNF